MLDLERKYYDAHRAEWLSRYRGKFVLIKGTELVAFYTKLEEALTEGARRYGLKPFLVRRVDEAEESIHIPALTLGLLRADSTHST